MDRPMKNSVLVVDDDIANLDYIQTILEHDYTVYTTRSGKTAIQIAKKNAPDLILLDIIMPDLDGFEVLSALKKSKKTSKIPVIILSGLENDTDEERGLDLEASDFIHKPISAKILKLKVRNQIQIVNQIRAIEQYADDMHHAISKMEAIVNNYNGVIWSIDKNGVITSFSGKYLNVIGVKPSFLIGKNIQAAKLKNRHLDMIDNMEKTFLEGSQDWISDIDGVSFHSHTTPLYDSRGKISGMVGSTDDVTEHIKLQNELEAAVAEAEMANKAKSAFLARMSHEIRTPLNAVMGISDIQLQNETLSEDVREAFARISNSGDLLLGIINDILDISKIEAGKLELKPDLYHVPSMINDTVFLNMIKYENKPIEFILNVDENIPSQLYGDEIRIKQILNNLLSNAFKYTASGVVELSLEMSASKKVAATKNTAASKAGASPINLVFRVRDTGQGMTEEQLEKLFDEYTRFNMETNRTTVGTGLGMGITQNLIHMMNGQIKAESKRGEGSLFTVFLPQGSVGAPVLGKETVEKLRQFHNIFDAKMKKVQILREPIPFGKVLVVDDIDMNLYVTKGMLSPYGLQIDTALSGAEAIEKIESSCRGDNLYDLVFMDHMMPVMDGIETTKRIREMGAAYKKLPIIALTANAVSGMKDEFLSKGFNGFISKPVNMQELDQILKVWISPDKITKAEKNGQKQEALVDDNFLAYLGKIHEINPEIGLKHLSGRKDMYRNTLGIFYRRLELECNNMTSCLNNQDINNFLISIHAMKSMLAIIGASALSETAHILEIASSNQDINFCTQRFGDFRNKLLFLHEKLSNIFTEENNGAAFDGGEAEKDSSPPLAAKPRNGGNALLVDDVQMILYLMKDKLERFGLRVDTATSGSEAIDKIKNNVFDIVFMDYLMPEMDGIEATRRIRKWEKETNAKKNIIIALTAEEETEAIEIFSKNGFDGFLSKPVATHKLAEIIRDKCDLALSI